MGVNSQEVMSGETVESRISDTKREWKEEVLDKRIRRVSGYT